MRINLSEIYEGWRNHLIPPAYLKSVINKVSKQRLSICDKCSYNSKFHKTIRPDVHCTECGCPLKAKTKCLSCFCGIGKWEAVVTEKQEEEMLDEKK